MILTADRTMSRDFLHSFSFLVIFGAGIPSILAAPFLVDHVTGRHIPVPNSCRQGSPHNKVVVDQGDSSVLRCHAFQIQIGSSTLQQVFWRLGGRPVYPRDSQARLSILEDYTLVLKNTSLYDSKIYTCVALWKDIRGRLCIVESTVSLWVLRKLKKPLESICGQPWHSSTTPSPVPWMAMLKSKFSNQPFCGGALISDRWVLSATHCYDEYVGDFEKNVVVKLGAEDWSGEEFEIEKKYRHGESGRGSMYDMDLLLIKLKTKVEYSSDVWPICLPKNATTEGELGLMTGWGPRFQGGRPSHHIKKLHLPVRSRQLCANRIPRGHSFTESMLCTGRGDGRPEQCKGDSGGPFAVQRSGKWTLAGVVSFGEACSGHNNQFGYSVEVGQQISWIRKTVLANSFTSTNYGTDCEEYDYSCLSQDNDFHNLNNDY